MKKLIYIQIISLFLSINLYSQVTKSWVQTYNGPGNDLDWINSSTIDATGNIYVTGGSTGNNSNLDFATIKYSSSGSPLWITRYSYSENSNEQGACIVVGNLGDTYVSGSSDRGKGNSDIVTIKYNSLGIQEWIKFYNGSDDSTDYVTSIAVDDNSNLFVLGSSYSKNTNFDYVLIKYNSSGTEEWIRKYNGIGDSIDIATSLILDTLGNIYLTGESSGNGTAQDYVTIKYNTLGAIQWVQRYNGIINWTDIPYSIGIDKNNNVYVTGSSGSNNGLDYLTVKYNAVGQEEWIQRYNGHGNNDDYSFCLAIDDIGNVYITGWSYYGPGLLYDYATIKYSSQGEEKWVTRYNGPGNGNDRARSIKVDKNGNSYVTGHSFNNGSDFDILTIKYDSMGHNQWEKRYDGIGNSFDQANSLEIDELGDIYILGFSTTFTNFDYTIIKYSQSVGIENYSQNIPISYKLYQNYPNPFNPYTSIKFDLPLTHLNSTVKLGIFDINGKKIDEIVNKLLNSGSHIVNWDASFYPSGIYFYTIETKFFKQTKKMILIK